MLPVLITLLASTAAAPAAANHVTQDPSVRVWIDKDGELEHSTPGTVYVLVRAPIPRLSN